MRSIKYTIQYNTTGIPKLPNNYLPSEPLGVAWTGRLNALLLHISPGCCLSGSSYVPPSSVDIRGPASLALWGRLVDAPPHLSHTPPMQILQEIYGDVK